MRVFFVVVAVAAAAVVVVVAVVFSPSRCVFSFVLKTLATNIAILINATCKSVFFPKPITPVFVVVVAVAVVVIVPAVLLTKKGYFLKPCHRKANANSKLIENF